MKSDNLSTISSEFANTIKEITEQTQSLYLEDEVPWVVGYSGGKDSTAVVQLIWNAIVELPVNERKKPVHIISTDTLVENPVIALWVKNSLEAMQRRSASQNLPFHSHRLIPQVHNRFWVNVIGKGYPSPRRNFRWCTDRLKINPSNEFIRNVTKQNGEAILALGTRKAESSARRASMERHENSTRQNLGRISDPALSRVWVYAPIANWTSDDVWEYLASIENPWGHSNIALMEIYRGATKDKECPLVVDTSTPSCGDSRFGCFVCTLVEQDKSMSAMIKNDEEKQWMRPLLEIRNNWLDTNDRAHRDFRRMNGSLAVFNGRLVHGPYKQDYREQLLRKLLETQIAVREMAPPEVGEIELLSFEDLEEIRRIWLVEKHEIEDNLPKIYQEVTGVTYPGLRTNEGYKIINEDLELLRKICVEVGDPDGIHYQLAKEVLHLEQQYRTMVRRSGLLNEIEKSLIRNSFHSAKEAEQIAIEQNQKVNELKELEINTESIRQVTESVF